MVGVVIVVALPVVIEVYLLMSHPQSPPEHSPIEEGVPATDRPRDPIDRPRVTPTTPPTEVPPSQPP